MLIPNLMMVAIPIVKSKKVGHAKDNQASVATVVTGSSNQVRSAMTETNVTMTAVVQPARKPPVICVLNLVHSVTSVETGFFKMEKVVMMEI